MKVIKYLAALVGLILLLIPFAGCNSGKVDATPNTTNAIEKWQKVVPFTIILPTYLPKELRDAPLRPAGPSQGMINKNSVLIRLNYYVTGSNNEIIIDEENAESDAGPSNEWAVFLNIAGVKVLEEPTTIDTSSTPPKPVFIDLAYEWNLNGINFRVMSHGYSKDECRKVVESMIKQ